MQAEHVTWRDFLRQQLDERQKQRLVQALGIQRKTLRRWITGDTSTPHLQTLQHIAEVLPTHLRWRFVLLLHQDSALPQATLRSILPGLPPVLPASLYAQVLRAQATIPMPACFATTCALLFRQVLDVFDPSRQGVSLSVFKCAVPQRDQMVRHLFLKYRAEATQEDQGDSEQQLFLGQESIAGQALVHHGLCVGEPSNMQTDVFLQTRGWNPFAASLAAAPIVRAQAFAGVVLLAQAQPQAFTTRHLALLQQCSQLLAIGISAGEWYPPERIALDLMPPQMSQQTALTSLQAPFDQPCPAEEVKNG